MAPPNVKVPVATALGFAGLVRIVGAEAGDVRSSVQVYAVALPVLPAASAVRTRRV